MYRNEVTLQGDVASDVVLRTTKTGLQVANLRLRTEREREQPGDSSPEYVSVVCWRQVARVAETLHKGDRVLVQGYTHDYKTTDLQTGKIRYGTENVAVSVEPLELRTPVAASAGGVDPDEVPF